MNAGLTVLPGHIREQPTALYCRQIPIVVLCFLSLLIGLPVLGQAQHFRVIDIDTTDFPTVRARYYAFDDQGNRLPALPITSLSVTENGIPRVVSRVMCPPPKPPIPLSVVLTVDISGSMSGEGMTLAQLAARSFVQALPLSSECALTAFDDKNYLLTDFTASKQKLTHAISTLFANGGTDYDQGLLVPPIGAIEMAKAGKNKRVVVFLTDGLGSVNEAAILGAALANNVTIYCVTLTMPMPEVLKRIATRTGGEWFENLATTAEAADVYRTILQRAMGSGPCEIEWKSAASCDRQQKVKITCASPQLSGETMYSLPQKGLFALEFKPKTLTFRSVEPGTFSEQYITVTARNSRFTVKNISVSDPELFSVFPSSFSLAPGASLQLRVTFAPKDSGFAFSQMNAQTDVCGTSWFVAVGGFPGKEPSKTTLRLLSPNGGEIFLAGSDTTISWTGLLPQERIIVEYSLNAGKTWNRTNKPETGFTAKFQVPKTPCEHALVRISQLPRWQKPRALAGHAGAVSLLRWSPDGKHLLTASLDKTLRLWDTAAGETITTFTGHSDTIVAAEWSPDRERLLTASADGTARLWDAETGKNLQILRGHTAALTGVAWNRTGTAFFTYSRDGTVKIWDAQSGTPQATLTGHTGGITSAAWSPDDKKILTASTDKTAIIWDLATATPLHKLLEHRGVVNNAAWSPNGTEVITVSQDSTACIWDVVRGKIQRKLFGHKGSIRSAVWLYNGTKVATAGDDGVVGIWLTGAKDLFGQEIIFRDGDRFLARRSRLKNGMFADSSMVDSLVSHTGIITALIWDAKRKRLFTSSSDQTSCMWTQEIQNVRGTMIDQFTLQAMFSAHNGAVTSLAISQDGKVIASSSTDSLAMIWKTYSVPRQIDVSDEVFTIIRPKLDYMDVVFRDTQVGTQRDSVFTGLLRNSTRYPITVRSMGISGTLEMAIVSAPPPFVIPPRSTRSVELRFKPATAGVRRGTLTVMTDADTMRLILRGRAVQPPLVVHHSLVDFGRVNLGESKDTTISLARNTTPTPIRVKITQRFAAAKNDFHLNNLQTQTITIPAGAWSTLPLRFSPSLRGRVSGTLALEYAGIGSPALIRLVGTGITKMVVLQGRVTDSSGKPLQAAVRWEDLDDKELIGETFTNADGTYRIELPAGKRYGYYFEKQGYYPLSRNREFTSKADTTINEPVAVLTGFEDVMERGGTVIINNIFFEFRSSELKEESFLELNRMLVLLKRYPQQKIEIAGHTDNIGLTEFNKQLSLQRAESVLRYLVKNGCDAQMVIARGYGSAVPLADNANEEGRAKNRRVEIRFMR